MYHFRIRLELGLDGGVQALLLLVRGLADHRGVLLGARAEMQQERRVAAVVQDHVGVLTVRPLEDAVRVIPVLRQCLALDREHRGAALGDRRRGVVLGRIDVARRPAHFGAQCVQRLDQHRGLDRHVQRSRDARAAQRLRFRELLPDGHQARHLGLGDLDLLAAPFREPEILDQVIRFDFHRCIHDMTPRAQLKRRALTEAHRQGFRPCRCAPR